jgi:hypothetical protein
LECCIWEQIIMASFHVITVICLKGLGKITENPSCFPFSGQRIEPVNSLIQFDYDI